MPASAQPSPDEPREPLLGAARRVCVGAKALASLSELAAAELCLALIESGQSEEAWEALELCGRQELLPGLAQKACSARRIDCERFAELGAKAARWAVQTWGAQQDPRLGEALSELLVVRNGGFLARAQAAAGVGLLESLARSGAMFSNGMTLANARRLSWAFDELDERFERACLERDLSGPRMLLGCPGAAGRKGPCSDAARAETGPAREGGERRRFGGFGLLGLATGRHEPFKRALDILEAMGFDPAQELARRAERRSYGVMEFPPHNCMTAALVARSEDNARLIMLRAPAMSPEKEMRELMALMGPDGSCDEAERERQRFDFQQACALACSLEIERSAGGQGSGSGKSKSRSI